MRMALPGADSAAGCIDEDAIETRFGRRLRAAIPRHGAVIKHLGAGGAFLQDLEPADRPVAGPDEPLVLHEIGQMQRLAAFAGEGVPPRFAGRRRTRMANHLRSQVLDFELAPLEWLGEKQILRAGVAKGGRKSKVEGRGLRGGDTVSERPGE